MQLTTGSIVDRYTVVGTLGEGGMAMVYRVRHNQLGTEHALKVLTIASVQIAERLLQEGRVQATLRHPNIVAVTDIVDLSGSPGLIMELVNGPSLDDFLVREMLSLDQVDALASGILAGVAAAHAQDLIHRDLKPANIMLAITPAGLVPKVTDFGLAKLLTGGGGNSHTRTGSTMGTPHYMAPEQIRDSKNVGPRADVFSLGVILYEMVTQQRAFDGEDLLAIFNAVASGEYVPVRDHRPALPDRMERAITGALQVALTDRVASVAELQAIWSGGEVSVAPAPMAGPWDTEVLAKASSMSASAERPVESAVADPGSPPTTLQESQRSVAGPSDGSLVPVSASSDSLVNTRSLLIGVGSTAALLGMVTIVLMTGLVGAAVLWTSVDGVEGVDAPPVLSDEAPAAVVEDSDVPEAEAVPEAVPKRAAVRPKASQSGDGGRDRAPMPEPVAAVEDGPSPESVVADAPVDLEEAVDPDGVVPEEDPEVADDADDGAADEVDEPVADEPVADADAVLDEVVDPHHEPIERVLDEPTGDPRDKLPPDLRSQSTSVRMDGLSMREDQADATWIYDVVVRHDPHSEVRKKAWRTILLRWRRGVGSKMEHQRVVVWMLSTGTSDQQVEAIDYIARFGTDVNLLAPPLADSRSAVRRAAVDGIGVMVGRTGQKVSARMLLEDLAKTEQDSKTLSKIESTLSEF